MSGQTHRGNVRYDLQGFPTKLTPRVMTCIVRILEKCSTILFWLSGVYFAIFTHKWVHPPKYRLIPKVTSYEAGSFKNWSFWRKIIRALSDNPCYYQNSHRLNAQLSLVEHFLGDSNNLLDTKKRFELLIFVDFGEFIQT